MNTQRIDTHVRSPDAYPRTGFTHSTQSSTVYKQRQINFIHHMLSNHIFRTYRTINSTRKGNFRAGLEEYACGCHLTFTETRSDGRKGF